METGLSFFCLGMPRMTTHHDIRKVSVNNRAANQSETGSRQTGGQAADRPAAEVAVAAEGSRGQSRQRAKQNTIIQKKEKEGERAQAQCIIISIQCTTLIQYSFLFFVQIKKSTKTMCVCSHRPFSLCLFPFLFPLRRLCVLCSFLSFSYHM
jgi:hypothetical protein